MTSLTSILLIDSDAGRRAAIAAALAGSNLNFRLTEAADAGSGLAAAKSGDFDCLLIDTALPGVVLPDYLAQLTSAEGGRQAVVALTDRPGDEEALALLRAGALDSLSRCEANPRNLARAIRYAKARRGFVIEMQAAREDAEAKSRAVDRLNRQSTLILSIIAHDLRNPFQVLLGMSERLAAASPADDRDGLARRAAALNEAAMQANGLMERLFAWASLHMDARGAAAPVPVQSLFEDCARAFQESAEAKGLTLDIQATGAQVLAQADAAAAILRNLVANAVKFTGPGGRVIISAAERGGEIAISVTDTGVGLSEAQAARLFQIENRSTSAGTSGEAGGGLGLLLCRDLAEWVGGSLEVESELGRGATFRLALPAAPD